MTRRAAGDRPDLGAPPATKTPKATTKRKRAGPAKKLTDEHRAKSLESRKKGMNPNRPLTARQEEVARLMAAGEDSLARAAQQAGYSPNRGRSWNDAEMQRVAPRVKELRQQAAQKALLTGADVLRGLMRIADVDPADVVEEDGVTLRPLNQMPLEVRKAVASWRYGPEGQIVEVKLAPRMEALTTLAKYFDLFHEKVDVRVTADTMSDEQLAQRLAELLAKGKAAAT